MQFNSNLWLDLKHESMWRQVAGKKEGGALPDTTNIPPLSKSLPQPLEEHEGSIEGDNLALSYRCDRLNTASWLSSQPKGERLRF
jgi:hypothetical protein